MVYSNSSRGSLISSIVNQSQGGGSKKAGLPRAHNTATSVAFAIRGYPQSLTRLIEPQVSSVCVSRSIGMIANVTRMKC